MKKRKKKRLGSCLTLLASIGMLSALLAADDRKPAPAGVIAGSVFRNTGLALPGASVTVKGLEKGKKKQWKTTANNRGEFLVRVPPGPAEYNVNVTAGGYRAYDKVVTFGADERIDLSVILEPEKPKP